MPRIEIQGLTHRYSKGSPFENVAIDHIDLTVGPGETVGLIGHTGSGKSTLIQHLNALLRPTEGRVLLDGEDIFASKAAMKEARRQVGLVFQYPEYQLFEETVYADIAFGPKNLKLPAEEIDRRVRKAARFVGLSEEVFNLSPLELSGGQKRRTAIAGVLAMEPEVLLLDEPSAGLDPAGRESILENLMDWKKATGATLILVTHDMSVAAELCGRLVVLHKGRVAFDGTPAEVFANGKELQEMGLALPESAEIARRLRAEGLPIPEGVYTRPALKEAILALRGGDGLC